MKEKLEQLGWKCSRCPCPGIVGYDCANDKHRGFVIQLRDRRFKIIKNSIAIESDFNYELDNKLKANGLL